MFVSTDVEDDILVITINNAPVNALGAAVRSGIVEALDMVERDPSIKAVVLTGAGKQFSAGADIKEFGKTLIKPYLPDVLSRLENSKVITVAAVNGQSLGGGLETALSCRYRVASRWAMMGLPEVKLGLIPGAGGTQRLPRLIGIKEAAAMITSGKPINAMKAVEIGLVDAVAENDVVKTAVSFAREKMKTQERRPLAAIEKPFDWDPDWLEEYKVKLINHSRGQESPIRALEAVRATGELSFVDGLKREREIFSDCMKSPQRKGLIHSFFAERAAKKVLFLEGSLPAQVDTIGIIGAGTMGVGIAIACAAGGFKVSIVDSNADVLSAGINRILQSFQRDLAKGRITEADANILGSRVTAMASIDALTDADLIIEAVVEKMDVKKAVFSRLDRIAKPTAIFASNTSYLNIDEIAAATNRPASVIGMHFFSPANIMRLLEIIRTKEASHEALATAVTVGTKLNKINVLAGVCDGFIGNRILKKYRLQADYLVEDGAMPSDVDRVMREFGFAMGPFQVSDLAGLDIGWHNRRREDSIRDPRERYVPIADKLYELDRLGQKTGAGWYQYTPGDRTPQIDPVVEEVIRAESSRKNITRRPVDDTEIRERIIFAMINEGAKILEEGIASRALDIDLVLVHGYGFPAYRGGPMFYANELGLEKVLKKVQKFERDDPFAWSPSELLVECVREKRDVLERV